MRSFVLTGGRAATGTADDLDVVTMVTTVPGRSRAGMQPEHQRVIDLCRGGCLSVIEVAGHLGQPLTITRILLGDLIDSGLLAVKTDQTEPVTTDQTDQTQPGPRSAAGQAPDPDRLQTLERMLHGLQAL